jgi:hypothetical protein
MLSKLANALTLYYNMINNTLIDMIDLGVNIYIDNIVVYR